MKFAVYGHSRRVACVAENDGGVLVDLNLGYKAMMGWSKVDDEEGLPSDILSFIAGGSKMLENARMVLSFAASEKNHKRSGEFVFPIAELRDTLPSRTNKIACAGANFADHAARNQSKIKHTLVTPEEVRIQSAKQPMWGFWKHSSFVAGPDQTLRSPPGERYLDYECELAGIIGKEVKGASPVDAGNYFWGYTILNDFSLRGISEPGTYNFAVSKNFDGSCALGPFIVTSDELPKDLRKIRLITRVNGKVRQDGDGTWMMKSHPEILSFLSRRMTFYPGDVISSGTCGGTAMDSTERNEAGQFVDDSLFLKPGDLVEAEIPNIGVLRTRIE